MKQRITYGIMTFGAAMGVVAAFLQTLEKLTLLRNKDAVLTCNFNSVFSCSNVLNSWQASVFGFPNSIMCMGLFIVFFTAALAGLLNSKLSRSMRLTVQGIALATLAFALWFIGESVYVIHSLCIFCMLCLAGLLLVNGAWLRINAADLPISGRGRAILARGIAKGADIFGWFVVAAIVAFAMVFKFA